MNRTMPAIYRTSLVAGGILSLGLAVLAWRTGPEVAGCGASSGCSEVLSSRWARVLGIPVGLLSAAVYLMLIVAELRGSVRLRGWGLAVLGGASVWFVSLQLVALDALCPWCLAAHGTAASVLALAWLRSCADPGFLRGAAVWALAGVGSVAGLAAVQGFMPGAGGARTLDSEISGLRGRDVLAHGEGRVVGFAGGAMRFNVDRLPRLGRADAPHVLVEYFDYTCHSCREMSGQLDALVESSPGEFSIIVLPVPLDRACHPGLPSAVPDHAGACELARLALAVWRADPPAFPALHREWMKLGGIQPDEALRQAEALVGKDRLRQELASPWVRQVLEAALLDYAAVSRQNDRMPKLFVRDKRMLHGLPESSDALESAVRTALAP